MRYKLNNLIFSVVPYEKIDKTNFMTISRCGVTHYYPDEMVFTPLDVWEQEYDYYSKVVQVRFIRICSVPCAQLSILRELKILNSEVNLLLYITSPRSRWIKYKNIYY